MITPLDIENKKFRMGIFAYQKREVNEFLKSMALDYERLYNENIEIKEKMQYLNDRLKQFESIQDTLQSTLVVAQKAAEDLNYTARENSEKIIREAEHDAAERKRQALFQVDEIKKSYGQLQEEGLSYVAKLRAMLNTQLEVLKAYEGQLKRGE